MTIRPSSYTVFAQNPRAWYNRTILGQQEPIGSAALLGSAVHYGIENNTTNVKPKIDELVAKELYDFSSLPLEQIYIEAPQMVEAYLQTDYKNIPAYAIEQRYTVKIDVANDVELSGQCDKIAEDFTIIDYKTSRTKLGSADSYLPQLDIYAHLLYLAEGIECTKGKLINIKRPTKNGVEVSHIDCEIDRLRGAQYVNEIHLAYLASLLHPELSNIIYRQNPYSFIQ